MDYFTVNQVLRYDMDNYSASIDALKKLAGASLLASVLLGLIALSLYLILLDVPKYPSSALSRYPAVVEKPPAFHDGRHQTVDVGLLLGRKSNGLLDRKRIGLPSEYKDNLALRTGRRVVILANDVGKRRETWFILDADGDSVIAGPDAMLKYVALENEKTRDGIKYFAFCSCLLFIGFVCLAGVRLLKIRAST